MNPRINSWAVLKYLAGRIEMHPVEIAASSTEYAERSTETAE